MLLHMKRDVDEKRCKYIEIGPVSCEPNFRTELIGGVTYLLHRLDLRPTAVELFRKFHKDCVQRKIRRAERENLQYEEGSHCCCQHAHAVTQEVHDLQIRMQQRGLQ